MGLLLRFAAGAGAIAATIALLTLVVLTLPVTQKLASAVASNAAQSVALMAYPAAALVLAKWRKFVRKDYALAFFLALYAMVLMQVPVHLGGMTGWGPNLVLLSGIGRWVLFASAALFARAALKDECDPWGWWGVTLFVLGLAVLL